MDDKSNIITGGESYPLLWDKTTSVLLHLYNELQTSAFGNKFDYDVARAFQLFSDNLKDIVKKHQQKVAERSARNGFLNTSSMRVMTVKMQCYQDFCNSLRSWGDAIINDARTNKNRVDQLLARHKELRVTLQQKRQQLQQSRRRFDMFKNKYITCYSEMVKSQEQTLKAEESNTPIKTLEKYKQVESTRQREYTTAKEEYQAELAAFNATQSSHYHVELHDWLENCCEVESKRFLQEKTRIDKLLDDTNKLAGNMGNLMKLLKDMNDSLSFEKDWKVFTDKELNLSHDDSQSSSDGQSSPSVGPPGNLEFFDVSSTTPTLDKRGKKPTTPSENGDNSNKTSRLSAFTGIFKEIFKGPNNGKGADHMDDDNDEDIYATWSDEFDDTSSPHPEESKSDYRSSYTKPSKLPTTPTPPPPVPKTLERKRCKALYDLSGDPEHRVLNMSAGDEFYVIKFYFSPDWHEVSTLNGSEIGLVPVSYVTTEME